MSPKSRLAALMVFALPLIPSCSTTAASNYSRTTLTTDQAVSIISQQTGDCRLDPELGFVTDLNDWQAYFDTKEATSSLYLFEDLRYYIGSDYDGGKSITLLTSDKGMSGHSFSAIVNGDYRGCILSISVKSHEVGRIISALETLAVEAGKP